MLQLYDHPLSPYAQKVKLALMEKGIEFETLLPTNLGSGEAATEFAKVNPRAEVPALVDGDVAVFDSTIILEYIEDKWPTPSLMPASPAARARVRMIEETMDTHYEAINWGLGELTFFGRASGELADEIKATAARQVASWHAWLESQLGDAPWFNGESFGWGDIAVVPYINGSAGFGLQPPAGSRLAEWAQHANQRESVKSVSGAAASMAMGDNPAGMSAVRDLLEQGLFKREYRDHRLEWMIKSGGVSVVLDGLDKDNIRFTPEFGVN